MESEWDDMCKDIDDKYNTDLILAQIDPTGMSKLEKTATYSDVDYVPSIVILKNGKKIAEYDGPKNKDNMIEFLLKGGYVKHKMKLFFFRLNDCHIGRKFYIDIAKIFRILKEDAYFWAINKRIIICQYQKNQNSLLY